MTTKLINKRTHLIFPDMGKMREAQDFLFALNVNFTGILKKPVLSVAPSLYKKHDLDLYLPSHVAGSSFNYKTN